MHYLLLTIYTIIPCEHIDRTALPGPYVTLCASDFAVVQQPERG